MKLNFACGKQTWPDFYCVDAVAHPKRTREPDLLHAFNFTKDGALINRLPLDAESCDEVHSYHFIEHVFAWEAPAVVKEFRRLLKPGGLLVLECPNLELAARNLLAGMKEQMWMFPFYGDPEHKDPFMCHKFGYTMASLESLVRGAGFKKVMHLLPLTHGQRITRDMRLEAR
jgi:predicted SAM-dependent methyltransferase